jgi:tryptophan synthase beta chain
VVADSAALKFARTEGIIPAPEPTHAIAATIREALACKESGEAKVIVTALCGHGHFDQASYDKFLAGGMVDLEYPADKVRESMSNLPKSTLD